MEEIVPSLRGRKILLFGRNKPISEEDMSLFLESAGASLADDESEDGIALVVKGRLMNPVEESICDDFEKSGIPVVEIEAIESYYASTIDRDMLLGSLKIFRNKERIINLLHNDSIDDNLFCEILKLYDWGGKAPFESDENRDVAGSMVSRFYKDIERNHNIEFSPVGPFLVAAESDKKALLEAIAMIPDYEITQRSGDYWMPATLHEALLVNGNIPTDILENFARSGDERKVAFAAAHPLLSEETQKYLFSKDEKRILEGLAKNPSLSKNLYETLFEKEDSDVRCMVLKYQPLPASIFSQLHELDDSGKRSVGANIHLDEESAMRLFDAQEEEILKSLASNENLSSSIYEKIESTGDRDLLRILAANPSVEGSILKRLLRIRDKELYRALAANPSTPKEILENFSKIRDKDIAAALASNPSTPIEILLGYQMDAELSNILKRNEAFGDYIKENIGWQ